MSGSYAVQEHVWLGTLQVKTVFRDLFAMEKVLSKLLK